MADYYLINDQIKFYFDIEDQHIEYQGTQESLEPKEAKILKYILENHVDGLIKSETILDNNWAYWSDKKVLQKVLSTLRRKFKLIGVTENGFIAAGTEYKIKYRGVLVNDEQELKRLKKANTSKILSKVNSAAIWTFIGALSIFLFIESSEEINFKVDNIFQATSLPGVSLYPALSPDGQAIVFAHKTEQDSKLYLKVETKLNYQILTQGFTDQMPSWSPSGRKIAFQRLEDGNKCGIFLLEFDSNYSKIDEPRKLIDCHPMSYYNSITWRSEDEILYSDKNGSNMHYDIMSYSLQDQSIEPYFEHQVQNEPKVFPGHYFITYDHNNQTLYSLSSPDYYETEINRFDNNGTPTTLYRVDDILRSIALYQGNIVFKDIDNQLKAFSPNNIKEITTIYQNPLKPISYPNVSSNNNKLLILTGSLYRDEIYAMNIETKNITQVLSSQHRLVSPQQINQRLYYISNRTGIRQIYSYNKSQNSQITNFTKNHRITHYSASNNHQWLAINFLDKTVLYQRKTDGLHVVKTFPMMSYPAFSTDSKRLLLSTTTNRATDGTEAKWTQNIVEYDLMTMTESGISIKNAHFGKYHEKGIIYIQSSGGIKLFTLNGTEDILEQESAASPFFLSVNKDYVFFNIQKDSKVVRIDINTKEKTTLPALINNQITNDDTHIFYRKKLLNNLSIFKGELIYQ